MPSPHQPRAPPLKTPTLHAHTSAYAICFLEKHSVGSYRPGPKYHPPVFVSPQLLGRPQIYCTSLFRRNIACMWSVARSLRPNLPLMLRPIYNIHFSTNSVCPPPSLVPSLQPHFSASTVSSRAQSALSFSLPVLSLSRLSPELPLAGCVCLPSLSAWQQDCMLRITRGLFFHRRSLFLSLLDYGSHGCEALEEETF